MPRPLSRVMLATRPSGLGLLRRGDGANLLHHAQGIVVKPALHELAAFYAVYADARNLHPVAARGDAHKHPLVRAACRPARDHLIPLGYQVLDGHPEVGEGSTVHLDEPLGTVRATARSLGGVGIMGDIVGGYDLIYEVHIPFIVGLLHKATGQILVLFRHRGLLLPNPLFPLASHRLRAQDAIIRRSIASPRWTRLRLVGQSLENPNPCAVGQIGRVDGW